MSKGKRSTKQTVRAARTTDSPADQAKPGYRAWRRFNKARPKASPMATYLAGYGTGRKSTASLLGAAATNKVKRAKARKLKTAAAKRKQSRAVNTPAPEPVAEQAQPTVTEQPAQQAEQAVQSADTSMAEVPATV